MQKLGKGTIVVQKIEQQMLNRGKWARLMRTNQGIGQEHQRNLKCCLIIAFSCVSGSHLSLLLLDYKKGTSRPFKREYFHIYEV